MSDQILQMPVRSLIVAIKNDTRIDTGNHIGLSINISEQKSTINTPFSPDFEICCSFFFFFFIRLMDTAREIIKESLPIKCLEAVIVGLYPFFFFYVYLFLIIYLCTRY